MKNIDQYYMQQALVLAARARLTVSPNPMVGCIILKDGKIIAEAWHIKNGQAHAECLALDKAGQQAKGSTVYVTLEPCCHIGKTRRCTDALIKSQVKEVIIATLDPNPKVSGKGVEKLKEAAIKIKVGILERQAQELNKIYFYYQNNHKPYVFAKWAISLDGKISVNSNDSKQISSYKAAICTHQLRNICDAILIGKNTLLKDNPKLNVRLDHGEIFNPVKFVIFNQLQAIDLSWHILDQSDAKTIFVCSEIRDPAKKNLQKLNIDYWIVPIKQNKVCVNILLEKMADAGMISLLLEGGMQLFESFIDINAINEFITYLSPVLIANSSPKKRLVLNKAEYLGCDLFINANPRDMTNV